MSAPQPCTPVALRPSAVTELTNHGKSHASSASKMPGPAGIRKRPRQLPHIPSDLRLLNDASAPQWPELNHVGERIKRADSPRPNTLPLDVTLKGVRETPPSVHGAIAVGSQCTRELYPSNRVEELPTSIVPPPCVPQNASPDAAESNAQPPTILPPSKPAAPVPSLEMCSRTQSILLPEVASLIGPPIAPVCRVVTDADVQASVRELEALLASDAPPAEPFELFADCEQPGQPEPLAMGPSLFDPRMAADNESTRSAGSANTQTSQSANSNVLG